jgi:oxygen-independent coproporphyrinogen-3 oxidase
VYPRHLYVHVPFCARRCAYCDFSIAVRREVPVVDYVRGVERELDMRYPAGDEPRVLDTLYFGGGTPSRLGGPGLAELIARIRDRVVLAPGAEVTLEANPEDVTPAAVAAWAAAGANRLSLGSQSFDENVLSWMHRTHRAGAIGDAVRAARGAGITNVSLDLIFALPPEIPRDWTADLEQAIALEPAHVSLYGLTVEPQTPLARWLERGTTHEAEESRYEREFLEAHHRLRAAGFEHYEVSNFARHALRSRHNSAYWANVPYAGVGPAAHEFTGTVRRWNVGPYAEWQRRVDAGSSPVEDEEELTPENRLTEQVYLGLRTDAGLVLRDEELPMVRPWIDAGWGTLDASNRLRLTGLGWLRLDALSQSLTLSRSR